MKDAPAFDFYPSDWLSSTLLMSYEEKGLYLELLAMQWENGALPTDDQLKRLRTKPKTLAIILTKFPPGADGLRRNIRLETERQKQQARRAANIDKARKAAGARWSEPPAPSMPQACLKHSVSIVQAVPESCPPITHHPSPVLSPTTTTTTPPARLEQVLEYAKQQRASDTTGKPVTDEIAEAWFDARTDAGWQERRDGHEYDIRDWQANLRKFARVWHQRQPEITAGSSRGKSNGHAFPPRQTAHSLRIRQEEVERELKKLRTATFYDDEARSVALRKLTELEVELATIQDQLKVA
jgi:uncharacterized protein YdaU (DUF1376 family)